MVSSCTGLYRFPPQTKVWHYSSKGAGKIKHTARGGSQYKLYTLAAAAAAEPSVDDALDVVLSELDAIYTLKKPHQKYNVCTEDLSHWASFLFTGSGKSWANVQAGGWRLESMCRRRSVANVAHQQTTMDCVADGYLRRTLKKTPEIFHVSQCIHVQPFTYFELRWCVFPIMHIQKLKSLPTKFL